MPILYSMETTPEPTHLSSLLQLRDGGGGVEDI